MRTIIQRFLPFDRVSPLHPLFKLEPLRVRRLLDYRQFLRLTLKVIFIVFVVLLLFWLLAVSSDNDQPFGYRIWVGQVLALMFLLSIGLNGILDFSCMVATTNSFAAEFLTRRWDLLHLTPLKPENIADVKHSAARLRIWRMTMVDFGVRLSVLILTLVSWLLSDGLTTFRPQLSDFFLYVSLLVAVATYLAEPFWRVQAVTALGLAISVRMRNTLSLTLASIGAVLALWILQPLIIGLIFWGSGSLLGSLIYSINNSALGAFLFFLVTFYAAAVLYGFYAILKNLSFSNLIGSIDAAEA